MVQKTGEIGLEMPGIIMRGYRTSRLRWQAALRGTAGSKSRFGYFSTASIHSVRTLTAHKPKPQ